ncbi:MAG TPA: signal recognition particle-docking protein FtsY [Thermodesulfobacteriota bacterium]|nr:signal recognition particle-docking protein FtsY [Thermodesulfobacteriota bacterium]
MDNDSKSKGFWGRFSCEKKENNAEENNKNHDQAGQEKVGFFQRLKSSLRKTHEILVTPVDELILGRKKIDEDTFEGLEEILLASDVGPQTALSLIQKVQKKVGYGEYDKKNLLREYLKEEILAILAERQDPLDISQSQPFVIMVIGVNGSGKTTTIAKLAHQMHSQGKKVLLAAADTFRAAGIEQLEIWGERVGCEMIKHKKGSDPSAVAYDAIHAALARNVDVLIVDTAGRLHTKVNLMEEIKKIKRIMGREYPGSPHEVLLVLDSTTGQNAIAQATMFKEALGYTGIVLTKLDGSAKGGVIVGISNELKIPIRFIGIGEKMEDLREFNAQEFVEALFE